jgi:hypothetical protein
VAIFPLERCTPRVSGRCSSHLLLEVARDIVEDEDDGPLSYRGQAPAIEHGLATMWLPLDVHGRALWTARTSRRSRV